MKKAIILSTTLILLFLSAKVQAVNFLQMNTDPKQPVIIWTSGDAMVGCLKEIEANGKAGVICSDGLVNIVPAGTKVRRVSGWIGMIRIQVLNGKAAGKMGYVPMEYLKYR